MGFFDKLKDIPASLKKVPAAYWILGVGGTALAVDYAYEGDNSIVSSVWRMLSGKGHMHVSPHAAYPSRPGSAGTASSNVFAPASTGPAALQEIFEILPAHQRPYYAAWPARHHGEWNDWGRLHGYGRDSRGFGHDFGGHGFGGHGFGHDFGGHSFGHGFGGRQEMIHGR